MKTCAAGALLTFRSKRGSRSTPATLGIPICTGGSSARSSASGRAGGLRSAAPASSDEIAGRTPLGGGSAAQPATSASETAVAASFIVPFAPG